MRNRLKVLVPVILAIVVAYGIHVFILLFAPPDGDGREVIITIPSGATFSQVVYKLRDAGVIRNVGGLTFLARIKGAYTRIKAGEYVLDTSMSPSEVLDKLVEGDVKRYKVTIPEGYNMREIAVLLAENGLVDRKDFISTASDRRLAEARGIKGNTLEGYLFPDTYLLTKGLAAEDMIDIMLSRFKSMYTDDLADKAVKVGLSQHEVVTLASIIEKETGRPEERRSIAAVFHNRLKKRMPLQSDPTVIYGLHDFDGNLTKRDLRKPTPYNTYRFYGLPPGPIANPGKASLEAAVDPAEVDYLYFVSKNDGTHHFSKNLKEHNRAVYIYQKKGIR